MTVAGQITDERLGDLRCFARLKEDACLRDEALLTAKQFADFGLALTELQHRREAEAGALPADDNALAQMCEDFQQGSVAFANDPDEFHHLIEFTPPQLREFIATRVRAASPSSPASGVRVKVKPLEWHGPDFEDEYWAASLDLKYVIHPPNERGVRWLGGVGGYFRLVDEAKSVAEKHNEARILSALGEHP